MRVHNHMLPQARSHTPFWIGAIPGVLFAGPGVLVLNCLIVQCSGPLWIAEHAAKLERV